jgi:signal transduction histidine kinase
MMAGKKRTKAIAKFLLVDDVEENLHALEAVLRRDDVQLFKATSGRDALALMNEHDFALSILDVQMPEMDGFELAERMRSMERTRRIPIIFVTAGGRDSEFRFQGYEAGAVDFLFKPLDTRILRHKVEVFVELYKQRAEIAETLRLNEELVAIVTHDLRSPLASILMVADVLAKSAGEEKTVRQAERIRTSTRQLISNVNELLDLSRARLAGGIPIDRRDTDLSVVATRLVGDMSLANPARKIDLVIRGTEFKARVDGARMEQVLMNLVGNALVHGVKDTAVEIVLEDAGDDVLVHVSNQGDIPAEALPRIFEPFQQGYGKRKSTGLGLGLYIVDQIVFAHGGSVTVDTGRGTTTFTIRLGKRAGTPVPAA